MESKTLLQRLRVALGGSSAPKELRVIITGGFQDSWAPHHVDIGRYDIPQDITRVVIGSYEFDLVKNEKGVYAPAHPDSVKDMKLDYNYFLGIQRPTSVIVEDRRIFHDLSLFAGDNAGRLDSFLEVMQRDGGPNWFDNVYSRIERKRQESR